MKHALKCDCAEDFDNGGVGRGQQCNEVAELKDQLERLTKELRAFRRKEAADVPIGFDGHLDKYLKRLEALERRVDVVEANTAGSPVVTDFKVTC